MIRENMNSPFICLHRIQKHMDKDCKYHAFVHNSLHDHDLDTQYFCSKTSYCHVGLDHFPSNKAYSLLKYHWLAGKRTPAQILKNHAFTWCRSISIELGVEVTRPEHWLPDLSLLLILVTFNSSVLLTIFIETLRISNQLILSCSPIIWLM